MKLEDFDYNLPPERIAQAPAKPRDRARLLVVRKKTSDFTDEYFYNVINYLNKGDVLVLNDSKVIPARLIGKKETGGKVEILLLAKLEASSKQEIWEAIGKGKNIVAGTVISFSASFKANVISYDDGLIKLSFNCQGSMFEKKLNRYGQMPLPPYINSLGKALDKANYQTVYAAPSKGGSVAAPTAGLHFTPRLLKAIRAKGVKIEKVTLHVGLGTFRPIKVRDIRKHKMHSEWASISATTMKTILETKKKGCRIIAVGTTSVRVLETAILKSGAKNNGWSGLTNIFIYPPYKFKLVDGLITNFHLPKSTLLLLVSALASKKIILAAYKKAIEEKYRFYSYGDAMLII
ncbi:MAG: tRNA preQ1(34) S-adenosylmethionine ribosyltransferase-isomerase QueA [Candidatus Falkowbacteria bacterium]|nr:tRNA preQ1(34) S-adenosylmethionine ribosyltransferase-isomerase QueA [Candidatus Falkowbacteria bacterium]